MKYDMTNSSAVQVWQMLVSLDQLCPTVQVWPVCVYTSVAQHFPHGFSNGSVILSRAGTRPDACRTKHKHLERNEHQHVQLVDCKRHAYHELESRRAAHSTYIQ